MMVEEGKEAPDFCLKGIDPQGEEGNFCLSHFRGKRVILYFYPRDNTPGCTLEACDFRDNMDRISSLGYVVVGVSPDSVSSHKRFREKHSLNFYLLSDEGKEVAKSYGVLDGKNRILRSTFLIDEGGKVLRVWKRVRAKGHVEELLNFL